MLINCKVCNSKNKVSEIIELKDSEQFENRLVFKSTCYRCQETIGMFLEIRKTDKKAFFKKLSQSELSDLIRKEKRNIIKFDKYNNAYSNWRYGINKEIKNKYGKVLKIRQYSADYGTNKKELEKEICCL
jgi:hypothetical protein